MTYKEWLDNEYSQWIKALQESTVHNFKEHPMVKRMLGEPDRDIWEKVWIKLTVEQQVLILQISVIGGEDNWARTHRMIYYAQQILKRNPSSICEIGGGVGQFYAILRALGYKGRYFIEDLLEAHMFQKKYLLEVAKQTGLNAFQEYSENCEMVVSFYALGEFDDDTKEKWITRVVNRIPHGYIAWNPHSGASDDLSLFKHDIKVTPGIEPGIKIIEW